MYSRVTLVTKFIRYFLSASNGRGHGIHSPFVFTFVRDVLHGRDESPAGKQIELLRARLLKDASLVDVDDMGAGSGTLKRRRRKISDVAATAVKPKKFSRLLFRVARFYQATNILELGTSLGITTSYFSSTHPEARVITIEGSPQIAGKARQHFDELGLKNVATKVGDFDAVLPEALEEMPSVDLAFIDGNHRKDPTLRYFSILLPGLHPGSVVIFDDIHWSAEMEEAWQIIQSHPSVTCTIDLFFIGLVFFRKEIKVKQHFTIRF